MANVSTFRAIPWTESLRPLFRLAPEDWTPPATIQSITSPARLALTFVGKFEQQDGSIAKLTTRLRRPNVEAQWEWHEEKLDLRLAWKPSAGSAQ